MRGPSLLAAVLPPVLAVFAAAQPPCATRPAPASAPTFAPTTAESEQEFRFVYVPRTAPAASQPATAPAAPSATAPAGPSEPRPETRPPEKKRLTLDALYGPEGKVDFSNEVASGMRWLDDGEHYLHRLDGQLVRVRAETGDAEPAYNRTNFEAALLRHGDFDEDAAARIAADPGEFHADHGLALFRHGGARYAYEAATGRVQRLFDERDAAAVTLSPRGGLVGFIREDDVFVVDPRSGGVRQLTRDGTPTLRNGLLDWVYQEEIYGRGQWRGYWWSDDDRYIAYLQLDESPVPVQTIVHQTETPQRVERQPYPYAGDPNPRVALGVVGAAGGSTVWVDLSGYADHDILIVRVAWSPDHKVVFQVQDREQRWLDLNEADPLSGASRTLVRERSPAWVNVIDQPHWLSDGTFLWRSERDGWQHVFHYARDGTLLRRVTGGDWDVRELHGVDERTGWVYLSGTRDGPIESHVYRASLAGGPVERISEPGFSHAANFDARCRYYFDTFSSLAAPRRVHLRRADGSLVRVLSDDDLPVLDEYALGRADLLRVSTPDGWELNALLVLPADHDPRARYPVLCQVYGGPESPTVRNSWRGIPHLHDHLIAQHGIIVWYCDPRSASSHGVVSAWQAYQRLGAAELADVETGVRWLVDQGYADPRRIAISGGSYGGYLAAYALTRSRTFKLGLAGFPVTDWRHYDSIYTERYMRTPQNNPEGYRLSSVLEAAADLHGRLLLFHGLIDDNVHVHNTMRLVQRLQAAGKPFELMVYPRDRHGIGSAARHEREMVLRFLLEHL